MACVYSIDNGKTFLSKEEFQKHLADNLDNLVNDKSIVLERTKSNVPPKEPTESKETQKGNEGKKVGISHKALSNLAEDLGLEEPKRGVILTPEESIQRGRGLLKAGADAEQIGEDFKKDGKINTDIISVARAHFEKLIQDADIALDKFGKDSKEFKEAKDKADKWQSEVMKPMGTEAGASMTSLQGQTDIVTGAYSEMERVFKETHDREPNEKEKAAMQKLAEENKILRDKIAENDATLPKIIDKAIKEHDATEKERRKKNIFELSETEKADRAKLKNKFSGRFNDVTSMVTLLADKDFLKYGRLLAKEAAFDFTEFSKKAIEDLGDKVKPILKDWFDKVGEENKEERLVSQNIKALENKLKKLREGIIEPKTERRIPTEKENDLKAQINAEKEKLGLLQPKEPKIDVLTHFVGKKGNKFTPREVKAIWDYVKAEYIDKGENFDKAFSKAGQDLGLTADQIRNAISSPKGLKPIIEERYNLQRRRNQAIKTAKEFVRTANQSIIEKIIKGIPNFFFEKAIFGHGTVGMVTHAGMNIFDPKAWKEYFPAFAKQFKFLTDKNAYEKALVDFQNHPEFNKWKRAGLAVDPFKVSDDYSVVKKIFPKLAGGGDRGFFALKLFRMGLAEQIYNGLSAAEKADPETIKEIAKNVNHATGTSDVNFPSGINTAFFAPKLEASRWARIITQPAKAINTFSKMAESKFSDREVPEHEKAAAKLVARRAGTMIATYAGLLAVNQAILSATGSKKKINFTNPLDNDWLKFKIGDKTVDVSGGIVSTLHFIASTLALASQSKGELHGKTVREKAFSNIGNYATGKFSPFAQTAFQTYTAHDFLGNTMPWSNKPPEHKFNHKMTWKEWLWTQAPIPAAEAAKDVYQSMEKRGVKQAKIEEIFNGISIGLVSGGTGARIGVDYPKTTKNRTPIK